MSTKSSGRRDLLDGVIRAHCPRNWADSIAYQQLIESVRAKSSLLSPRSFVARTGSRHENRRSTNDCVAAIARMARFHRASVRSACSWNPDGDPVQSLSAHLFARFDVPSFAHRAWFGETEEVRVLLDMARGVNPRKAVADSGLSSKLTKRAAHCFANAPDRFGIKETIRWAQAVAMGAGEPLANRLVDACKGFEFDEDFWQEMLAFLIYSSNVQPNNRERSIVAPDDIELRQMVTFAHKQRHMPASEVLGYGVICDSPLQPEFSFRGRTLRSFRRHMQDWKNEIELPISTPIEVARRNRIWPRSGLKSYEVSDQNVTWKMVEICESKLLYAEGGLMQHCVATYEASCRSGRCSIWSLRKCTGLREKRVVTVEVWPEKRMLVQARAKRNAMPTKQSMILIHRWAKLNDLEIPDYLSVL